MHCGHLVGSHATGAAKAAMNGSNFLGISAEIARFSSEFEHARACAKCDWQMTADALELSLFPHIDRKTGVICLAVGARKEDLCDRVSSLGRDLGLCQHKFGVWSVRKIVSSHLVNAGSKSRPCTYSITAASAPRLEQCL